MIAATIGNDGALVDVVVSSGEGVVLALPPPRAEFG
jgi:hypothetical protein